MGKTFFLLLLLLLPVTMGFVSGSKEKVDEEQDDVDHVSEEVDDEDVAAVCPAY